MANVEWTEEDGEQFDESLRLMTDKDWDNLTIALGTVKSHIC